MELAIAFINLTLLEIVLGIDNVLFISILADKLPKEMRDKARKIGLLGALVTRILLLLSIKWIIGMTEPVLKIMHLSFSARDLILLGGGIFLLYKASSEIYNFVELRHLDSHHDDDQEKKVIKGFRSFILQVIMVDLVFSIDSVITAVGLVSSIPVMVASIIIAVLIMIVFSGKLANFIGEHPSLKILALAFLIVIGVVLTAEGFGEHVPKGYIYFAMGFTLFVEMLSIRRKVKLTRNIKL